MNPDNVVNDLWGQIIEHETEPIKPYGAGDSHVLFVGGEQSGKSSLINQFFGRGDSTYPTLALAYQCCNLKVNGKEKVLHFWELGGGVQMESLIPTIATEDTISGFVVFVCFDLSKSASIIESLEWLDILQMRLKDKQNAIFLAGTHYDLFESKSPQDKEIIVQGLRSIAAEHKVGLVFTSSKMETLINRFKNVIKYVCIANSNVREKSVDFFNPVIVGPGADTELQTSGQEVAVMMNKLSAEIAIEKRDKSSNSLKNVITDPGLAEEDIDSLYLAKKAELNSKKAK